MTDINWDIYKERNERFKELVKGKSVALIARAPYLCTLKQAEKIDSYDLVARGWEIRMVAMD